MKDFKICFFTEGRGKGKLSVTNNMRTDLAWRYHLNADHISLDPRANILWDAGTEYDLAIIIPPKDKIDWPLTMMAEIKARCKKVSVMQEGPADYWTDYTLSDQIKYLELLNLADFLWCHNTRDIMYYRGLTDKETFVLPPVLVHESIPNVGKIPYAEKTKKDNIIIGGNMCKWYNGMASLIVANKASFNDVYIPSMGRKVPGEERIEGLTHLPYMMWATWMAHLQHFAFGIHLMPTFAAGTFALNCAYVGIPCIGYDYVDTQRDLFPGLSFEINNIEQAVDAVVRTNIYNLNNDRQQYDRIANQAKEQYLKYSPPMFKHYIKDTISKLYGLDIGEIYFA